MLSASAECSIYTLSGNCSMVTVILHYIPHSAVHETIEIGKGPHAPIIVVLVIL